MSKNVFAIRCPDVTRDMLDEASKHSGVFHAGDGKKWTFGKSFSYDLDDFVQIEEIWPDSQTDADGNTVCRYGFDYQTFPTARITDIYLVR